MNERVLELISLIRHACDELSSITGRPVSPDGHLVGSVGELFAQEHLGIVLARASNAGFVGTDCEGRRVEIKTTTRRLIAFSAGATRAQRLIVLHWPSGSDLSIVYDGPIEPVIEIAGPQQKNGQRVVSLSRLGQIDGASHSP